MPIHVTCPACKANYVFEDRLADTNIRCRACQAIFQPSQAVTGVVVVAKVAPVVARKVPSLPPRGPSRRERYEPPLRRQPTESASSTGLILALIGGFVLLLFLAGIGVIILLVVLTPNTYAPAPAPVAGPNQGGNNFNPGGQNVKPRGNQAIPGDMHAYIRKCVQENNLTDVDVQGFTLSKKTFREAPPEGAILIGFQTNCMKFANTSVIESLRAIYQEENGEKMGQWFGPTPKHYDTAMAKPGFAVSAINIRTGLLMDGFALRFSKLGQGRLLLDDSYDGNHFGGMGGGLSKIGDTGAIYVGLCGHLNDQGVPCSMGLITVRLPND
jgi:hypothetical protein